jgi:hypothetical protein
MLKKILLLTPLLLFSFEDLGIQGKLYNIKEQSLKAMFKPIFEKNKDKIKPMIIKAYNKAFTKYSTLPKSTKDTNITTIDYSIVPYDIINPYNHNQILYKKGTLMTVPLPKGIKQSFCVLDGSWNKKIVDEVLKECGKCSFYLVSNVDIRKFVKKYKLREVYPYSKNLAQRFGVTSLPNKVILFDKYRTNQTYNFYRIKKEVEKMNNE